MNILDKVQGGCSSIVNAVSESVGAVSEKLRRTAEETTGKSSGEDADGESAHVADTMVDSGPDPLPDQDGERSVHDSYGGISHPQEAS